MTSARPARLVGPPEMGNPLDPRATEDGDPAIPLVLRSTLERQERGGEQRSRKAKGLGPASYLTGRGWREQSRWSESEHGRDPSEIPAHV
jgi:hypothetical protein